jgi:hypothetical protein
MIRPDFLARHIAEATPVDHEERIWRLLGYALAVIAWAVALTAMGGCLWIVGKLAADIF